MVRAFAVVLLAFPLLAVPALAEEPPSDPATLDLLIRSEDARQVAWGAHLAGREGVREALPALLAFLDPDGDRAGDEWNIPYRHVLDALIRLDATVPAALLGKNLPKYLHRSPMTFILLTREAKKNEKVLLGRFDEQSKSEQGLRIAALALGNVLVLEKTPGFAARIVPWIETTLQLRIYDTDEIGLGGGAGGPFPGRGDTIRRQPEGYPPYPFYRFELDGGAAQPLVADGVRPVYVCRSQREGTRFGWGGRAYRFPRGDLAREWIASLLDLHVEELGMPKRVSAWHRWRSPEAYVRWASEEREKNLRRHREVLEALLERGVLTKDEVDALRPRLTVEIHDQRKNATDKLPPLPAFP